MADREVAVTTAGLGLRPFPVEALAGGAAAAARALLGAVLVRRVDGTDVHARIVEVEAYDADDPASHSARGRTPANATMFGAPGTAYVYRSYGVHWCLNVVCGPPGEGAAVLVRAAEVLSGTAAVQARRPGVRTTAALLRGPGCLTLGLGIAQEMDGWPLCASTDELSLQTDGRTPPWRAGPRVGVSKAADRPWRWFVPDCDAVSRYRRSPRADTLDGDASGVSAELPDA